MATRGVGVAAQQVRQADDGVHRRADLVAHVGEEYALGAVRRLGAVTRIHQLFVGAVQRARFSALSCSVRFVDQFLQPVAVPFELGADALLLGHVPRRSAVMRDAAVVLADRRACTNSS